MTGVVVRTELSGQLTLDWDDTSDRTLVSREILEQWILDKDELLKLRRELTNLRNEKKRRFKVCQACSRTHDDLYGYRVFGTSFGSPPSPPTL